MKITTRRTDVGNQEVTIEPSEYDISIGYNESSTWQTSLANPFSAILSVLTYLNAGTIFHFNTGGHKIEKVVTKQDEINELQRRIDFLKAEQVREAA